MAVPKRKTSKQKLRSRKAANRYKGVQLTYCTNSDCGAPARPHMACPKCGMYKNEKVLKIKEKI